MKYTPMVEQYLKIKKDYQDMFLFYRLGDFYEMFFDDAIKASKILEITLTAREGGAEKIPMCGVPFHSSASYIDILVNNGYKVAICEQVSEPGQGKIVERKVVQVVTPGTYMNYKNYDENNFLGCVYVKDNKIYFSFCDIMTGDSSCTVLDNMTELQDEIFKNNIKEIVSIKGQKLNISAYITEVEFNPSVEKNVTADIEDNNLRLCCNTLLEYIEKTQYKDVSSLKKFEIYFKNKFMYMTNYSIKNLEVTQNMANGSKKGSLLSIIDKTSTAAGSRKLKKWLENPLLNINEIKIRQQLVEDFVKHYFEKSDVKMYLKEVYDLERIATKVSYNMVSPRELLNLKKTLEQIPNIKNLLLSFNSKKLVEIANGIDELADLADYLENTIDDDAGQTVKEGSVIKAGFNAELDSYKNASKNGSKTLLEIEKREKERTGLKNLKIGYNKVFGHYIEISKVGLKSVDPTEFGYHRKQTLSNCERFISEELKEVEEHIINSKTKIEELELKLFQEIKTMIYSFIPRLQKVANTLSDIDVFISLSDVAEEYNYVKPIFNDNNEIKIIEGRHPIVERNVSADSYISNDCTVSSNNNILLITGPNMSGKSTYMRQLALIVILAQIGSFVPVTMANLPIFDKIFTRIGASDDLAGGKSTFMVEMMEAKNALVESTKNSLLIFDEIGRGTSTYDGIALAQSILEYINNTIKCKTLFSTHYHELTKLEDKVQGIKNIHVSAKEDRGELIFLYKIKEGPIEKSYGIHVAKLAQLPDDIITCANNILTKLEEGVLDNNDVVRKVVEKNTEEINEISNKVKIIETQQSKIELLEKQLNHANELNKNIQKRVKENKKEYTKLQLDLGEESEELKFVKEKLNSVNFMETTPFEAFNLLYELQKKINKGE
ncbi:MULTISPECIES: DNA mismatch repair protein MutS [Gemella]|uniref:DNA mismatch repair protein MutS n=1 Tax=Gemella TaxID=1378 RepID=UPI0007683CE7|nr:MULTISPECIES: DNA mismatch repair protein MutS [Gemella]AME09271.1 DNA mismatch repair protein MutS [Gemella sp. oral taxon 928]AXI26905.1 DNA mismatch repair protein MutS [Gemella sp. ND 6198]